MYIIRSDSSALPIQSVRLLFVVVVVVCCFPPDDVDIGAHSNICAEGLNWKPSNGKTHKVSKMAAANGIN